MRLVVVLAALLMVLGACGSGGDGSGDDGAKGGNGGDAAEPTTPIVFETIAKGASGPAKAAEVVARSADELLDAWRDAGRGDEPPASLGQVDFGTQMVLAVFQGEKPTAGFDVEITGVSGSYEVAYTVSVPAEGCITAQVITSPFHLVAVPRSDAEVTFSRQEHVNPC